MPELKIITSLGDGELGKYLRPGQTPDAMSTFEVIGCLPGGMKSGLPSFAAVIALPGGQRIIAETSWRNMSLGLVALAARWGTP